MLLRWIAVLALLSGTVPQDKAPEPDATAQKEKLKTVKDLFKDEYAKKAPADQAALARQLLNRGGEMKDDPVAYYVMLREARDLAAGAGDVETCMKAIDEMAKAFSVQPSALKLAALAKASAAAKDPEAMRSAARAYLALVSDAVRADDYDSAVAAVGKAELLAKSAQDPILPGKAQEFQKDLPGLKSEYQKVKADLDKAAPGDAEAVGRYLCFVRGAWEPGLLHLSNGAKGPLKAAVDKDLSMPADPEKQLEAADAWWDLSLKEKSPWRKARIAARAQTWYEQAAASATGLTKVKVDKRLAELEESTPGAINLTRLIDLKQDPVGEWSLDGGALITPTVDFARILIPYVPPEEFDLMAVVERTQGIDAIVFGLVRGTIQYAVWVEGYSKLGGRSGIENVDNVPFEKVPPSTAGPILASGKPSTVLISVRKTSILASIDGKPFVNLQGNFTRFAGVGATIWKVAGWKGMYLGTCGSRYRITKLQLTTISGQGKRLK